MSATDSVPVGVGGDSLPPAGETIFLVTSNPLLCTNSVPLGQRQNCPIRDMFLNRDTILGQCDSAENVVSTTGEIAGPQDRRRWPSADLGIAND